MKKKLSSLLTLMQIMTVFCLAVACSSSNDSTENKPDQPTPTPVDGTTFTIPASGGTITKENLTLQIPSGTFSGETKISVTTVNKGSALNDMEASEFYKITLPVSTKKPIQVSVKSENASEGCLLMARSKGRSTSMNEVQDFCTPLEQSTGSNNTFSGKIPLLEIGRGSEDITVGLIGINTTTSRAATQGDYIPPYSYDFSVNLPYAKRTIKVSVDYQTSYYDEKSNLILKEKLIPQALVRLDSLGFCMDADREKILIHVVRYSWWKTDMRENCWGNHICSKLNKQLDCVEVNEEKLNKMVTQAEQDELAKTLIHELGHYYQSDYDVRRSQWEKATSSPGAYLALKEASSVWTEHYYGSSLSSMIKDDGYDFLRYGLWNYQEGKEASHGYGMGVLFTYLAQQYGDNTIVSIFDDYKKDKDADECLTEYAKRNEFNINDIEWYNNFLRFTAEGKLIEGYDMGGISQKSWGVVDYITHTMKSDIYRYGMLVNSLFFNKNLVKTDNKVLTLSELEDGTYTEVYRADFHNSEDPKVLSTVSNVRYLGRISKNKPLDIMDSLEYLTGEKRLFFVTLQDPNVSHKMTVPSSLEYKLADPAPTLSLPQSPVEFSAEGGEKTVTVTSNCTDLSIVSHPSWCSARIEDNVLYLNATKNGEENERSGEVKVKATNSRGSIEAAVKVKQNKTFAGFMEYAGVIVHLSYGSSIQPYPGYLRGRVAYCTPYIDKDGNGIITSSGSYSTTVDGNRYEKWEQRYHTYEEDNVTWDISLTVSLGGDNPKIINGRVYTLAERKVNEDVEWENSNGETFKSSHYTKWVYETSFDISNLDEFILDYSSQRNSSDDDYKVWCNGYRATATSLDKFTTHVRNFKQTMDVTSNNSGFEPKHEEITLPSSASLYSITVGLWKDDHWHEPVGQ